MSIISKAASWLRGIFCKSPKIMPHVRKTYPRYFHVSQPVGEDDRRIAALFGEDFWRRYAMRGTSAINPVRRAIKECERGGFADHLNNKQRRRWRARVRLAKAEGGVV